MSTDREYLAAAATDIAAIKAALAPVLVDTWPKRVNLAANTSAKISTLLAALSPAMAFPAGTFRLTLSPHGSEPIYAEKTTAVVASSPQMPSGGWPVLVTKAVADELAVIAANATSLFVAVEQT